jgi:hypothetical protein
MATSEIDGPADRARRRGLDFRRHDPRENLDRRERGDVLAL